jgi:cyclic pyranopterin phosphate synthase
LALSAPLRAPSSAPLIDRQGRAIEYLRVSVTDRCNFRCLYCSPASYDGGESLLTREEIGRLVRLFAGMGTRRVRLTGGEPTLRKDLLGIAADARDTPGIEEVALTTNGFRLEELAVPLRDAGVSELNVSLDTLRPENLARVSGAAADLDQVLRGIDAAAAAGFSALKLNVVVMRGVNEGELPALARFAWDRNAIPRFIELMPFAGGEGLPNARVKEILIASGITLTADGRRGWGPAYYLRGRAHDGVGGPVGFIGAMTENFCERCNRVRLGPDGALRACLGGRERVPLRELMRGGAADGELEHAVREALWAKGDRHAMNEPGSRLVLLPMMGIGG